MSSILQNVNFPSDLRKLSEDEIRQLAEEIRRYLVNTVSRTGGHLAPNLGVVELTIAIHMALDCPRDKIVWDVGHQSYVHKLLTGRREAFSTLRQQGGISGFPKPSESKRFFRNRTFQHIYICRSRDGLGARQGRPGSYCAGRNRRWLFGRGHGFRGAEPRGSYQDRSDSHTER